jgi:hypothetical protein
LLRLLFLHRSRGERGVLESQQIGGVELGEVFVRLPGLLWEGSEGGGKGREGIDELHLKVSLVVVPQETR